MILTSQVTRQIGGLHQEEHCGYLEVIRTFVPVPCVCKKQTAVSHSRTEAEIISLGTGLRMGGIPALNYWDTVVQLLHLRAGGDSMRLVRERPNNKQKLNKIHDSIQEIDYHVSPNTRLFSMISFLYVLEDNKDNEAVIQMSNKGGSPTIRHVSRTHSVELDWLYDWIMLDPRSRSSMSTLSNNLLTC